LQFVITSSTVSIVSFVQSMCRPGQTLTVPGGRGPQISRQAAHEGRKVVSLTHWPPLLPRKYSWYSLPLEAESILGHIAAGMIMAMKSSNNTVGTASIVR
jgi:hypothetical protein